VNLRQLAVTGLLVVTASASALTEQPRPYDVPRTEHGHPDFQGLWATAFLTMLERPPGVENLTASPEQASALVAKVVANRPALIDPDALIHDIQTLVMVKGEYRTSVIVEPENGRMPLTAAGLALSTSIQAQDTQKFDNIEDRPLAERCLENLGYAPMRAVPVLLPRQIVQTRDDVVIFSEDSSGPRIIHLGGPPMPESVRSIGGYSVGHWEGDTLVVLTTNLRADYPARMVIGRPLPISRNTRITERFTRVSATELFYRFTIEDAELYTQPWSGELSMTRYDGRLYEYACHENNYSVPNALKGGRAQDEIIQAKQERP
jgi:hypothetical protein